MSRSFDGAGSTHGLIFEMSMIVILILMDQCFRMSDRVVMIPQIEKDVVDLEFVIDGVNREKSVVKIILDYSRW